MKVKPYKSVAWLRLQYVTNKKSIDEIAEWCGVSHNTIRQALKDNGFIR